MDLAAFDHILKTTRSVRKRLDLDRPVPAEIIAECLEIAIQAPVGSNNQNYHFMVVTDQARRRQIAEYYRKGFRRYLGLASKLPRPTRLGGKIGQMMRVLDSASYLNEVLDRVPVLIIPCFEGQPGDDLARQASFFGSIMPATWSLMLALRSRGLGSTWTTLHLQYAQETATLLGIPDGCTQVALLPVAYFLGDDFKPARRVAAIERTYWDQWGATRSG